MESSLLKDLIEVLLVNVILSGDNAVVIGLAARSLPRRQQRRAIVLGGGAAVALRLALTWPAEALLHLPLLRAGGGILLAWVAYRLVAIEETTGEHGPSATVAAAVRLIVLADLTMSLDNVLAVAAVAERSEHGLLVLIVGLGLSIPLVLLGGGIVATLMGRLPWLAWVGAAVLTYTAAELMVADAAVHRIGDPPEAAQLAFALLLTVGILGAAYAKRRATREQMPAINIAHSDTSGRDARSRL